MFLLIASDTTHQNQHPILQEGQQNNTHPHSSNEFGVFAPFLTLSPSKEYKEHKEPTEPKEHRENTIQTRRGSHMRHKRSLSILHTPLDEVEIHTYSSQEFNVESRLLERQSAQVQTQAHASSQAAHHERRISDVSSQLLSPEVTKNLSTHSNDVPFVQSPALTSEATSVSHTPCEEQKIDPNNILLKRARTLPQRQSPALKEVIQQKAEDLVQTLPLKENRRNALIPHLDKSNT